MLKISSNDVKNILSMVPPLLRGLHEKCASLEEKVSYYERKERVEKIAQRMEAKNIRPELSYDEKVENLMNADNLNVIEEAVDMQPKQIAFGALDLSKQAGNSSDAFAAFVEQLNE